MKAAEALKEGFVVFEVVKAVCGGNGDFFERVEMTIAEEVAAQDFPDGFLGVALR